MTEKATDSTPPTPGQTSKSKQALLASKQLLADGLRVEAVRAYRIATGCSLAQAMTALGLK